MVRWNKEQAQQKYAEIKKVLDRERDARANAIAELSKVDPEKNTFSHTNSIPLTATRSATPYDLQC